MHPFDLLRNTIVSFRNGVRSLRRRGLDFVVVPVEGSFPERAQRPRPLPFPLTLLPMLPSEVSLEEMAHRIEWLANDRRVKGAIFRIQDLQAGSATVHTLRRLLLSLRQRGKHTVAWVPSADIWDYYLASACEQVILPPPGRLNALGLRTEALFLGETLSMAGIKADLESIAEYKVTPDMFRRSSITDPHREMLEAILDSVYAVVVNAISEGRDMDAEDTQRLMDKMPMRPDQAQEEGLIDATLYEDELAAHLASTFKEAPPGPQTVEKDTFAPLMSWDQASRWLKRPLTWMTKQRIGVISLEGMIVPGKSRRTPMPLPLPVEAQAGAETLTAALRQAETDPHIRAVILHVDSPGGSSLASDLIWRQVQRLKQQKPVVVLMGEQAASGGYYVSAPAHHIVARPTTLTGSIGIWGGKFVLNELYDRLRIGREELHRGARADLYTELRPFDEGEREQIRRELEETYARFKQIVAQGRDMAEQEIEAIARGRVWTGEQATAIGLVDELGDFQTALEAAKTLAELDPDKEYTLVQIMAPRHDVLPQPFNTAGEQEWAAIQRMLRRLAHEHVWAMAPWDVRLR